MYAQNGRILKIFVQYTSYHHVYHSERFFDLDELELWDESWLTSVLRKLSDSSLEHRIRVNVIYFIKTAIVCLKLDPQGWEICRIREQNLTPKKMHALFSILENRLRETDHTSETMRQISGKFRQAVLNTNFLAAEEITVDSVKYRSGLGGGQNKLQPILNMEDHLKILESDSPLGAVPHKNYLDLIEKSASILQVDLLKIVEACNQELFFSKQNRLKIKGLECNGLTSVQEAEIMSTLFKLPSSGTSKILGRNSAENILAVFRKGVLQHDQSMVRNGTFKLHGLENNCLEIGVVVRKGYSPRQSFFSPERLTTIELQAIFILLLCRTGWNQDALVAMDRDGVISNKEGFAYTLQGFKGKTDDDTPVIFIEKTENDVIYAIELLVWNFDQLHLFKLLPFGSRRIWSSWTNGYKLSDRQSTTIQMTPKGFIQRNDLFNFSLSHIRRTVLCLDAYKSKSFETARRRGGHSSLGTTGRYLDQFITRNISSSINLQFQVDLQNKVVFNMASRKSNINQWKSIGDGSLCVDPYTGLYGDRGADLICSAENCHKKDGCPQRRIIITEEEILSIIRTREYYFKNWQRLRSENQERFNIVVAPKIAFNDALYNYVKNSRFGYVLNKIESALLDVEDAIHESRHI
ncbi:hypothetical protein [Pseudomonas alkylphenolica]|uniref:Uncharacterized protein n=1 Tax=Pseudomonas alkylphenolica TaxID=237609 RepID=A0A077FCU0_9PSED|nr:hypothetical protein [Pseudomonas alkylphenolica]AIL63108.1 hypothetical protein PSAKL28_39610 [Pseudomonas alkylphenolica]